VDNGPDDRPSISIGLNEHLHDGREIRIQRDGGLEVTDRRLPVAADQMNATQIEMRQCKTLPESDGELEVAWCAPIFSRQRLKHISLSVYLFLGVGSMPGNPPEQSLMHRKGNGDSHLRYPSAMRPALAGSQPAH